MARVGLTSEDPATFIPENVRLLYKVNVRSQQAALADVTKNLSNARVTKSKPFYEMESVKAYISHLKGEW